MKKGLKDGDILMGKPIRILSEEEAAAAISVQKVDQEAIDALYPEIKEASSDRSKKPE